MSKRIKFFLGHLAISLLIALIAIAIVFFVWYPAPLAQAVGVTSIFLMLLAIDVIVGPLFTLLVYKQGKKTLKSDLTVIILIQLSAFVYGFYSIAQGRPVWIAYTVDRFELIRANEVIGENQDYPLPWIAPEYISVEVRKNNAKEQIDMMLMEIQSSISPAQQPKYYSSFSQSKSYIQTKSISLLNLNHYNTTIMVETVLTKHPRATAWLPLKANAQDMVVLVDKQQGEVIKIVDLRPW